MSERGLPQIHTTEIINLTLLYKRPDSPYFYVTRTRESTKTSNRKQAEEFARKTLSAAWRQEALGEEIHTWKELAADWVDIKSDKKSLDRDEFIISDFTEFLTPRELCEKDLNDIPKDTCRKYAALVKARASASTANRHLACLRSMFNKAIKYGWLAQGLQIETYPVTKDAPRWLKPEEFDRIAAALPEGVIRDIAAMALQTGMRFSNVAGLRWEWITADGTVAVVPATSAKTKRTYTVPLSTKAREIVGKWRDRRLVIQGESPFVFTSEGEHLTTIRYWWERACTEVGIECRTHDLRHTFASWHMQHGTPDRVIQEMCGWSSGAMLQNYAHLATTHLTAYADNHNTPKKL